jgi:hypothetical protein
MSLQMQGHVPPPQRRDTHRKALEVPLNLPKAHHWYCWVCYNWGTTTTSWHWNIRWVHYSLVCTSKTEHLLNTLLHTQKKYICIKNLKNKLDKVRLSLLPDSSQSSPSGRIKSIHPRKSTSAYGKSSIQRYCRLNQLKKSRVKQNSDSETNLGDKLVHLSIRGSSTGRTGSTI